MTASFSTRGCARVGRQIQPRHERDRILGARFGAKAALHAVALDEPQLGRLGVIEQRGLRARRRRTRGTSCSGRGRRRGMPNGAPAGSGITVCGTGACSARWSKANASVRRLSFVAANVAAMRGGSATCHSASVRAEVFGARVDQRGNARPGSPARSRSSARSTSGIAARRGIAALRGPWRAPRRWRRPTPARPSTNRCRPTRCARPRAAASAPAARDRGARATRGPAARRRHAQQAGVAAACPLVGAEQRAHPRAEVGGRRIRVGQRTGRADGRARAAAHAQVRLDGDVVAVGANRQRRAHVDALGATGLLRAAVRADRRLVRKVFRLLEFADRQRELRCGLRLRERIRAGREIALRRLVLREPSLRLQVEHRVEARAARRVAAVEVDRAHGAARRDARAMILAAIEIDLEIPRRSRAPGTR